MGKGNSAETQVLHELEKQAKSGDVILQGVRFTDPKNGDVEADFLLLMPGFGVAVIEVKGGLVSYSDGEWNMTGIADPNYRRRINPVDQARKAKHSLRRYLDRQPEWSLGLIRSAWFVVMPETQVASDFGPEGLHDHLIGAQDLSRLRERLVAVLDRGLLTEPRPSSDNIEDAVSLLFRSETVSIQHMGRPSGGKQRLGKKPLVAAGLAGAVLAGGGLVWGLNGGVGGEECSPNYEPCIPVAVDLNCPDVGMQVRVIGEDIYNLDRDGNGIGCESYPAPE
jgi:hypothetical protein